MMIKSDLKQKFLEESRELVFLTVYLTLFLSSLMIFRGLTLGLGVFSFFHFGYNFFEALVLAKIILLGKMLHLGERYVNRSLIIPVMYMSLVFSVFVFVFSSLEHFLFSFFQGKETATIWGEFSSQVINQAFGKLLISFCFFILLFSFLQLSRFIGEEKVFKLFFRRDQID